MEKAEWKKEIDALLSSGTITDSDIEDYISKHPEIREEMFGITYQN